MALGSDEHDWDGFPSPADERDMARHERYEFNVMLFVVLAAGLFLWLALWQTVCFIARLIS